MPGLSLVIMILPQPVFTLFLPPQKGAANLLR